MMAAIVHFSTHSPLTAAAQIVNYQETNAPSYGANVRMHFISIAFING